MHAANMRYELPFLRALTLTSVLFLATETYLRWAHVTAFRLFPLGYGVAASLCVHFLVTRQDTKLRLALCLFTVHTLFYVAAGMTKIQSETTLTIATRIIGNVRPLVMLLCMHTIRVGWKLSEEMTMSRCLRRLLVAAMMYGPQR